MLPIRPLALIAWLLQFHMGNSYAFLEYWIEQHVWLEAIQNSSNCHILTQRHFTNAGVVVCDPTNQVINNTGEYSSHVLNTRYL